MATPQQKPLIGERASEMAGIMAQYANAGDKGIVGGYNGTFPLTVASVDNIYLHPSTGKYYKCIVDYNGESLTDPDNHFEELSLISINNKLNEYKAKKYGVKFSGSNPKGIRTFDAVGMVANVGVD